LLVEWLATQTITRSRRAVGEGAILETPLGLVGVGSDCVPTWRAVDVADYALSHNFLLLASSEGLRGYLIP
jgi:hypothetical protein